MNGNIKVSIIIPVYNVGRYLPKIIDDIRNQTFQKFEVIFIDDGSTDNSLEVIRSIVKTDEQFNVICQKNQGTWAARNAGLRIARGDYIYFLDPDDRISSNLLFDNIPLLQKRDSDMIVFGYNDYEFVTNNILSEVRYKKFVKRNYHITKDNVTLFYKIGIFNTLWHKIYSRKFIINHKIEFPRWTNAQDRGFNLRFCSYDPLITFNNSDKAYYSYFRHRPGASTVNFKNNLTEIFNSSAKECFKMLDNLEINADSELLFLIIVRDIFMNTFFNAFRSGSPKSLRNKYNYIKLWRKYYVHVPQKGLPIYERIIVILLKFKLEIVFLLLKECKDLLQK